MSKVPHSMKDLKKHTIGHYFIFDFSICLSCALFSFVQLPIFFSQNQLLNQPHSQGLSSLPPLVVGTETLLTAGHATTQNLGGRKIFWKGRTTGFFYCHSDKFTLDQMYLSTHPPCGFGWINGHVISHNQGLCSND